MITLEDGRIFPSYQDKALCWDIGAHNTFTDESEGYPRTRAVICAMIAHRPEQVELERRQLVRSSFDRIFGNNARKMLAVLKSELG